MGVPKESDKLLTGMLDFAEHILKPFVSLGGKQLQRGGKGSNELMKLCQDTLKAIGKMKDGLK
ncbi:hypothetical protein E9840_10665 [Tissierella creatinini]|nr:hypothetical protein E9840_10665 [Tissierella creatinini]TJX61936.1 hypothetical protein E8P77_17760 [Soehngenia saccharolytica]